MPRSLPSFAAFFPGEPVASCHPVQFEGEPEPT